MYSPESQLTVELKKYPDWVPSALSVFAAKQSNEVVVSVKSSVEPLTGLQDTERMGPSSRPFVTFSSAMVFTDASTSFTVSAREERSAVRVFGTAGAGALWTTSPIRVYGGGESTQSPFLERFSKGIGTYDEWTTNHSSGRNGSTRARSSRKVPILPADALAHLPEWRAVVDPAAAKPVLIETRPWFRDKVLTAMVEGREVRNGKIVKEKKTSTGRPSPAEGTPRVDPV